MDWGGYFLSDLAVRESADIVFFERRTRLRALVILTQHGQMRQARQVSPIVLPHWRNRLLDDGGSMAGLVCARVESLENVNPSVLCRCRIRS